MLAGKLYLASDPELVAAHLSAHVVAAAIRVGSSGGCEALSFTNPTSPAYNRSVEHKTRVAPLLPTVEQNRLHVSRSTEATLKSQFGQFLTSEGTAAFMAGLFPDSEGRCRLLDAGAGIGSLSAAFLERWMSGGFQFEHVDLDAFEIDQRSVRRAMKASTA